ncbi:MAG: HYExAFE family protein [Phycisphaerae bacterium]|nr:HYExAFE family protein [Phycisphaerae bacterium]
MKDLSSNPATKHFATMNHYERAFQNWLIDNKIKYASVDKQKRAEFENCKIKSFDFLLYPPSGEIIIAEVKGRSFKGTSFAGLAGFECWVTAEDIDGLVNWRDALSAGRLSAEGHSAVFVFAYKIENIDVDFDGREVYDFDANRYVFFAVKLDDYRAFMKRRSPKWQTVTLSADKFRQCAIELRQLWNK